MSSAQDPVKTQELASLKILGMTESGTQYLKVLSINKRLTIYRVILIIISIIE